MSTLALATPAHLLPAAPKVPAAGFSAAGFSAAGFSAAGGQDSELFRARALPAPGAGTVRIEVLEGRAQLVTAERLESLSEHTPPQLVAGPGHLTVRAASRLRMTWPGRASVLVHGPGALEWQYPAGIGARDGEGREPDASDTLELAVGALGQLDVEVRRGTLQLSLPESWRASLCGVAVQLVALPSGAVELAHHAGPPIDLAWTGERSASRPPIRVPAGSSVRLARPRYSPQEPPAEARRAPWPAGLDEWPWRAPSDTPELRAARLAMPRRTDRPEGWREGAAGTGVEPWVSHVEAFDGEGRARLLPVSAGPGAAAEARRMRAERRVQERAGHVTSAQAPAAPPPPEVTLQPAQPSEALGSTPGTTPGSMRAPEPPTPSASVVPDDASVPEEALELEPALEAAPPSVPVEALAFDPAHWRGAQRAGLEGVGAIAVQRAPGVEVRALSAGRVRVLVSGSVPGPVWCFAPGRDLRLAPGATIVFEADGRERMRLGAVESFEASPARPSWDALGHR